MLIPNSRDTNNSNYILRWHTDTLLFAAPHLLEANFNQTSLSLNPWDHWTVVGYHFITMAKVSWCVNCSKVSKCPNCFSHVNKKKSQNPDQLVLYSYWRSSCSYRVRIGQFFWYFLNEILSWKLHSLSEELICDIFLVNSAQFEGIAIRVSNGVHFKKGRKGETTRRSEPVRTSSCSLGHRFRWERKIFDTITCHHSVPGWSVPRTESTAAIGSMVKRTSSCHFRLHCKRDPAAAKPWSPGHDQGKGRWPHSLGSRCHLQPVQWPGEDSERHRWKVLRRWQRDNGWSVSGSTGIQRQTIRSGHGQLRTDHSNQCSFGINARICCRSSGQNAGRSFETVNSGINSLLHWMAK